MSMLRYFRHLSHVLCAFVYWSIYQFSEKTELLVQKTLDNTMGDDDYADTDMGIDAFLSYLNIAYRECHEINALKFMHEIPYSDVFNKDNPDIYKIDNDLNRYLIM